MKGHISVKMSYDIRTGCKATPIIQAESVHKIVLNLDTQTMRRKVGQLRCNHETIHIGSWK